MGKKRIERRVTNLFQFCDINKIIDVENRKPLNSFWKILTDQFIVIIDK